MCTLLAGAATFARQEQAPGAPQGKPRFEVSPGTVADALAGLQASTVPAIIPVKPWPVWGEAGGGWDQVEPWQRWSELVRAEAAAETPNPGRRAQLALCARGQGRDQDAWAHLELAAVDPNLLAMLLPSFLPGVSVRSSLEVLGSTGPVLPGGIPGDLRSGDTLRLPEPPPLTFALSRTHDVFAPFWRVENVPVGESRISVSLVMNADGIEAEVLHQGGPPVELIIILPTPTHQAIRTLYANWERLDDPHRAITLELSAEDPKGEIWGLLEPRATRWPKVLPEGVDQRLADGDMRLVGDTEDPFLIAAARGLGLLLEAPVELVAPGTAARDFREPLAIRLPPGPDRDAKLLGLLSLAEAYGLRQDVLAVDLVKPTDVSDDDDA
ncbi:MAG: hypothetical protein ACI8QS_002611 [Planctomycetota bacterium]|jgi:hypothetical protein